MHFLSVLIFKLIGWKIVGELPPEKKYIITVAPHTSNWDFMVCLFARFIVKTKVNFIAKKQAFFFPLGIFLRAIGGAPVDRSKKGNRVEQTVAVFNQSDRLILAIAPEGTRSPVTRWKEGFYHIACQAKIPIVMIAPDYARKEILINKPFWPSGDINKDFPQILDFYRTITGFRPKVIPEYHSKE